MAFTEISKKLDASLYPDLAELGGFAPAFQRELKRVGSSMIISDDNALPILCPHVSRGDRSCQVLLAAQTRAFSVSCWHRGVEYGNGWTPDLTDLAQMFNAFLERRTSLAELQKVFRWFAPTERGITHEQSIAAYVEQR